jgi:hypothetical protein
MPCSSGSKPRSPELIFKIMIHKPRVRKTGVWELGKCGTICEMWLGDLRMLRSLNLLILNFMMMACPRGKTGHTCWFPTVPVSESSRVSLQTLDDEISRLPNSIFPDPESEFRTIELAAEPRSAISLYPGSSFVDNANCANNPEEIVSKVTSFCCPVPVIIPRKTMHQQII